MTLAIANRQDLADQPHMQDDPDEMTEGMEPAPCGSQSDEGPPRFCIKEVGHAGRHKYRPLDGLVN